MKIVYIAIMLSLLSLLSFCKDKKNKFNYQPRNISNQEVIKITDEMSSSLEDAYIGDAGDKSAQYTQFEKLIQIATEPELIELTNHPNPAVRCFSFLGLAGKKSEKIKTILETHIKDKEKLHFKRGCIIDNYTVIGFMIEVVTPQIPQMEFYPNCLKLSKEEIETLKKKANIK